MPLVCLDGSAIANWESFHVVFAAAFGFPDFYGRNMDAWIDCMSNLGRDTQMTSVRGLASDPVVLKIDNVDAVPMEIFRGLVECAAFVNWRVLEAKDAAVLILAFNRSVK